MIILVGLVLLIGAFVAGMKFSEWLSQLPALDEDESLR